jgi:hypothetical protein
MKQVNKFVSVMFLLLLLSFLVGCNTVKVNDDPVVVTQPSDVTPPSVPVDSDIDTGVDGITAVELELADEDIDTFEQDLADLDW